ncbi:MAG: insulinase family protein [Phycisphaerae bacterium]|nr:insulinase family protein [Phycisphaerae bacterium]
MGAIDVMILDCGMPLLVERIDGVRSCGLTWLLPAGSARDPNDQQGLSALWAELLSRGAGNLDSRAQADAFDRLGVSRGTGVETFHMSVTATLLGSRLKDALPLIVDMVRRPRMDADALGPARDLCVQAIESLKDDPAERLMTLLKGWHAPEPINRSPLGTLEGIGRVRHEDLLPLWHQRATPRGSIIALAGDVEAAAAASQLNALLKGWDGPSTEVAWGSPTTRGYHHEMDQTNQVHIAIALDAPAESDAGCWPERIATAVLSGGMSGRLFTEVREKRALCYSVYASYAADAKYGRTVAYVGTTPDKAQQSLDVLLAELRRVLTHEGRITPEEFQRAVIGMKSKLVMSGESSAARANALARDWWKLRRPRTLEELTRTIDAVTLDQVNAHLAQRTHGEITIATIGPGPLRAG